MNLLCQEALRLLAQQAENQQSKPVLWCAQGSCFQCWFHRYCNQSSSVSGHSSISATLWKRIVDHPCGLLEETSIVSSSLRPHHPRDQYVACTRVPDHDRERPQQTIDASYRHLHCKTKLGVVRCGIPNALAPAPSQTNVLLVCGAEAFR